MAIVRPSHAISGFEVATLANGKFKQNCYVLHHVDSGDCLLVDPGSEESFIEHYLESHGLRPQKIFLTHGHFDHLGAVDSLMKRYEIGCEVHALEERLIRQAATYAFRFAPGQALRVPRGLTFFRNGSALAWNDRSVDFLPTPGHTSGSVSFHIDRAFVFTGDTLFHEHIGPTTYPESDANEIALSVTNLLDALPDECIVFPGHGKPWSIGAARSWWRNQGQSPARLVIF